MLYEKWVPHLKERFPSASRIAVGTKMDKVPEAEELPKVRSGRDKNSSSNSRAARCSFSQAHSTRATELSCSLSVGCSALTGEGLKPLFGRIVVVAAVNVLRMAEEEERRRAGKRESCTCDIS